MGLCSSFKVSIANDFRDLMSVKSTLINSNPIPFRADFGARAVFDGKGVIYEFSTKLLISVWFYSEEKLSRSIGYS